MLAIIIIAAMAIGAFYAYTMWRDEKREEVKTLKKRLLTTTARADSLEAALRRIRNNPDNAALEADIALDELDASRLRELE